MNNFFFKTNKKTYLRKKSKLLQDYVVAGLTLGVVVILFNRYNKRINPKDVAEDNIGLLYYYDNIISNNYIKIF